MEKYSSGRSVVRSARSAAYPATLPRGGPTRRCTSSSVCPCFCALVIYHTSYITYHISYTIYRIRISERDVHISSYTQRRLGCAAPKPTTTEWNNNVCIHRRYIYIMRVYMVRVDMWKRVRVGSAFPTGGHPHNTRKATKPRAQKARHACKMNHRMQEARHT